jgi:hypothetical protein
LPNSSAQKRDPTVKEADKIVSPKGQIRTHHPSTQRSSPRKSPDLKSPRESTQKVSPITKSKDREIFTRTIPAGIHSEHSVYSDKNHPLKFQGSSPEPRADERSAWMVAATPREKSKESFRTFSPSKRILSDD